MNKLKRIMGSIAFVLLVIDPLGYVLWNDGIVYAYELNLWKYKIIYNPLIEEEIIPAFTETHSLDAYVNEYNKQNKVNNIVARLNYERIGLINTDNNFIYTIYLDEQGKIIKVADGFDNVDFTAKLSIERIERLVRDNKFKDINKEIELPFKVKLKILRVLWS